MDVYQLLVDLNNMSFKYMSAMICWIYNGKAKDEVSSDSLLTKLGIQDLDVSTDKVVWALERSLGWIAEVHKLNLVAWKRPHKPKNIWAEVLVNDIKKHILEEVYQYLAYILLPLTDNCSS